MKISRVASFTALSLAAILLISAAATALRLDGLADLRYQRRIHDASAIHYCHYNADPSHAAEVKLLGEKPESYVHCMKWDLNADGDDEAVMVDLTKLAHSDKR